MINISKKQYVLSSAKISPDNMQEYKIGKNYLYADEQLNISECDTADGKKVFLLGNAFCTDKEGKRAEDDIAASNTDDILSATVFWTGRWSLITEVELITDASALMGAFYGEKDGNWFISSSPALIAEIMETSVKDKVKSDGINWQILPYSVITNVKALLCTQKISFKGENIQILRKDWICDRRALSTEEKCRMIADILVTASKNIHNYSGKKILLALTGGKDSRLTFSALIKSGVPFASYTAEHSNISHSDKTAPVEIAKRFGIKHTYIRKSILNKDKLSDYYRFCAGNSNGADAEFYAQSQFLGFAEDTLIIRSGLFEAGQSYARSYTTPDIAGFTKGMMSYYGELRNSDKQRAAFEEWLGIVKEYSIDYIDIRDRFYIEQRVGGWAAAIEQSLDISDFTSIQIANCAELLSILLSCNDEERKSLALSYETIKLLEPNALTIDINRSSFSDKLLYIKNIVKNPLRKWKKFKNKHKRK